MSIPATDLPARPAYRRRLHYVDRSIQRSLLFAMVTLEVALVAVSIWLAHWRLVHLIDDSMYRMHVAQAAPTFLRLAQETFPVLAFFVLLNLIALTLAAGLWSARQNIVLQDFIGLIVKTRGLDFSIDPAPRRSHEVLALAAAWRARERERFAAIRDRVAKLEAAVEAEHSTQNLSDAVEGLIELLS